MCIYFCYQIVNNSSLYFHSLAPDLDESENQNNVDIALCNIIGKHDIDDEFLSTLYCVKQEKHVLSILIFDITANHIDEYRRASLYPLQCVMTLMISPDACTTGKQIEHLHVQVVQSEKNEQQ